MRDRTECAPFLLARPGDRGLLKRFLSVRMVPTSHHHQRSTMDLNIQPYTSRRTPLVAGNGVVATSHPLAAQAGLAMLQAGGTAVDAAVATAAALTVVEPTSNGIGSDAFAIVWDGERLHGLNGSGRAPAALTPELVERAGHSQVPPAGWLAVTVPGAP